jgi:hemolysin III
LQSEEQTHGIFPVIIEHTPLNAREEFVNALSHAAAALFGIFGAVVLVRAAAAQSLMTVICCTAFIMSTVAVFTASALSHYWIDKPALLQRSRAWDQGLIYVMISGTYTPLVWRFADDPIRIALLIGLWVAAVAGFWSKVFVEHRVNTIGVISYLLLGWLPSLGLIGKVPGGLLLWMVAGGVTYVLGIAFLLYDRRFKYMHVAWHICVMLAAVCHYLGVYNYVAAIEA